MKQIKIFGAGGGGRNAILYMQQHNILEIDYCMVCSGFCPSEHSVINHICLFGDLRYIKHGSTGKYLYYLNTSENRQLIASNLEEKTKLLIIVVGLSGNSGVNITRLICQVSSERNIRTFIVTTFPYRFEGDKRREKAQCQLDSLRKMNVPIHIIQADNVFDEYPETDLFSSFPNLDKVVSKYICNLIEDYEIT